MTLHLEITVNAKRTHVSAPEAELVLDVDSVLALSPVRKNMVIDVGSATGLEQEAVFVWPFDTTAFEPEDAVVFLQYYVFLSLGKFNPPNLWQRFDPKASLELSIEEYETLPRRKQLEFKYSVLQLPPIQSLSVNGQVVDAREYNLIEKLERVIYPGLLFLFFVAVWGLSKTPLDYWFSQQTAFLRTLMALVIIAIGVGLAVTGIKFWHWIAKQRFSEDLTEYFFTINGIRKSRRERGVVGDDAKREA